MTSFEVRSPAFKATFDAQSRPARLNVTTTGVTPGQVDQAKLFEFLGCVAQRRIQFVSVFDLRSFGLPSVSLLKALGEWCKAHERDFEDLQLAIAILLTTNFWSGAARRLIAVVTAICPPMCPLLMCHSTDSAEDFFLEKVARSFWLSDVEPCISKQISVESFGDSCAPPIEATPSQPHLSQPGRFASLDHPFLDSCIPQEDSTLSLPSQPRRFASLHHPCTANKANHYVDLQDLSTDAVLVAEATKTEDIEDDQTMEVVRVITNAGLMTSNSQQFRIAAETLHCTSAQEKEIKHKHQSCVAAAVRSRSSRVRSKWSSRANTRGPKAMMNHIVVSYRALMA